MPTRQISAMTLDDLTVGIPTCDDDPEVLGQSLHRVLDEPLTRPPIVVDMSRTSAVHEVIRDFAGRIDFHRYPESTGVSASRNRLIALARTRYLLMIDADAVPEPGWAMTMRDTFERDPRAAVIGGRCLPEWSGRPPALFTSAPALDFLGMFDLGEEAMEVPRIMGTTYAIDCERLPGQPPFSTELGRREGSMLGFEEVAFCLGVSELGWTIWYEPGARVRHFVRDGRATWAWMQRRAFVAGQESRLTEARLEPLPRRLNLRDRAFMAAIAPMYLAGRIRGPVGVEKRPAGAAAE